MNFRLFEIVDTEKFQFVRIHKNGNGSVIKCIHNNFKKEEISYIHSLSKKVRFCVIRDPYKKLFTSNEHHQRNSWIGHINHSTSQIPYLFNVQCSHYIDISDLNLFLKIHFNEIAHENKARDIIKKNQNVEKYIDKDEVMKYLHLDYYMYDTIKKSPFLWEWQHGKIF